MSLPLIKTRHENKNDNNNDQEDTFVFLLLGRNVILVLTPSREKWTDIWFFCIKYATFSGCSLRSKKSPVLRFTPGTFSRFLSLLVALQSTLYSCQSVGRLLGSFELMWLRGLWLVACLEACELVWQ